MIIPSILTLDNQVAKERIELAKQMSGWVHLDFLDYSLYPFESLAPDFYNKIDFSDLLIEAHCMTDSPLKTLALPIKRILIHIEMKDWQTVYQSAIRQNVEAWLVFDPSTDFTVRLPIDLIGAVIMGVKPGQTGQSLIESTFERVEQFKNQYPNIAVTIDGGVGPSNLRSLVAHGADNLVMGNAIFHDSAPVEAYHRYVKMCDPHKDNS